MTNGTGFSLFMNVDYIDETASRWVCSW